ncbi:MAG: hypothetical protein Aureis2KO_01660 [Aureisphaera sp.]
MCFFLFFCFTHIYSQEFHFERYDTSDGLPSSEFYDVLIDGKGYAWFTSDRGIVRYNSNEFEEFLLEDGLSNLVNFTFFRESDNTFWVNGIDGSFTHWNGSHFKPFKFNSELQKLKKEFFQWFEIIDLDEDYIYFISVISAEKKAYSINRWDGQIKTLEKDTVVCSDNCSTKTKRSVKIWNALDPEEFKNFKQFAKNYSFSTGKDILISPNGTFLEIYNEFVSDKGELFIMSEKGLSSHTNLLNFSNGATFYLKDVSITSAAITANGEIWATSRSKGIFRIPSIYVKKIILDSNESNVDGLYRIKDKLYIKTIEGEIASIDKKGNIKLFPFLDRTGFHEGFQDPDDAEIFYFGATRYKNGKLELSLGGKVNIRPIDSSKYIQYDYSSFKYYSKSRSGGNLILLSQPNRVRSSAIDSLKNVYLGTYEGIFKLSYPNRNEDSIPVKHYSETKNMRINDLVSSGGIFWAGTLGDGLLYQLDDRWNVLDANLSSNTIHALYAQNDSILWVGTNNGLNKLEYSMDKLKIESIEYFDTSKGLSSNYIKDLTFFNENLYVATDKGINYFQPKERTYPKPILSIDEFVVNKVPVSVSNPNLNASFSHQQNDIKIRYTGISSIKPLNHDYFYTYQLYKEGTEKDIRWIQTNTRELEYPNLEPGKYTFKIQCKNSDNIYSDIRQLKFEIKPHYSQTGIFRLFAMILGILSVFLVWKLRTKNLKRNLSLELRAKEAELTTLRNQINPHFIFNSINTIQNYIFSDKKEEANLYIYTFSKMIRKSLRFSRIKRTSLSEEIDFIEDYLSIENMRFKDRFEYNVTVEESIDCDQVYIPALMSQPLVENAVKHAFKDVDYKGELSITYTIKKDILGIAIADNGVGFNPKDLKAGSKSLGIQIIRQRIDLLNEIHGFSKATLFITSIPQQGTKVALNLPILKR